MAQQIKLKRSAIAGKVPLTSSLDTGELAINTADGKLYFKRDDDTIQTIVTTNAVITGSLNINGPVTASFFKGDGSAITGVVSASYATTASSADSFTVRTALTASGLRYPTADGTFEGQLIQTNAAGTLSFGDPTTIYETIYNGEATSLIKGTPVYISGSQGANPIVYRADAADPAKMPVTYIVAEEITTASTGRGIVLGLISGIDLTGYTAGQEVYVAPGGGWTATRPTGSATVQFLGLTTKPDSGGKGLILNPGPATLPNLTSGNAWVGSSNSYPVAVPTASFYVTQAASASLAAFATTASYALKAESVGQLNQTVVINGNLQVFGTSSFTYVTSSQLNVADSFISVNIFEPAERFGGLKVYDSGSLSHLATASLAWDSLHNHWVYQNVSGSTYTGGMLLAGPRNTGSLGDEPNLTKWFVPRSDGGDHLNDSQIFTSGSVTKITGSLTTSGKVNIETVDNYGSDPDKFLAIVSNEVVYRTGAQLLSDIGGQTAGTFVQNAGGGGTARYIMRYEDSNSATTSSIYEDTSGRIGIKTTTPAYPLDISGSFRATSNSNIVGFVKSTSAFGATISYQDPSTSGNDWVSAGAYGNSFVIATGLQVKAIVDVNGHTYPNSDKLQDFGSGSNRWRTVYTDDIDASDTVTAGALDVKGNAIVSGSLTIKGTTAVVQQGILVSGTTSLTVASISTGSYEGAFLDYVIASGSNKRAGTLATVWTPSDIEWNDTSTLDLGSTVGAEFTPTLAGSNANLVLAVPAGTWTVKGHLRYM